MGLLRFDEKLLISFSRDKLIKIWDIENMKEEGILEGHKDDINLVIKLNDQ
jgi:WD40 repeat protein